MAITAPWFGGAVGGATKTTPRTVPRPMQGLDPVTGIPIPLPSPSAEDIQKTELSKASKEGMTLDKPDAIPVETLGDGGGNNKREKDCKCPASHLCQGKPKKWDRPENGMEYQLFIANLKSAPLVFSNLGLSKTGKSYSVMEWDFSSVNDWDGFWYNQCKLVEAKGNYGFLFKISKIKRQETLDKFEKQMNKHLNALMPFWAKKSTKMKKVLIEWHFQEKLVHKQVTTDTIIKTYITRGIQTKHTPYMDKKQRDKWDKKQFDKAVENGTAT